VKKASSQIHAGETVKVAILVDREGRAVALKIMIEKKIYNYPL